MSNARRKFSFALCLLGAIPLTALGGCGLYTPEKNPLAPDTIDSGGISSEGRYESNVVAHIYCELSYGLALAYYNVKTLSGQKLAWLNDWGTSATLTITAVDQSGLNPGLSLTNPLENSIKFFPVGGNVTTPQSFSLSMGGSGSANATRTETIQFTYLNSQLLSHARNFHLLELQEQGKEPCQTTPGGFRIESNLKIWQFIYDKAVIAATGNASDRDPRLPLYNTFTEDLTFVASLGGSITPTWKFARVSVNPTAPFLSASRSSTNELIVTLGPLQSPISNTGPIALSQGAQNQHNSRVTAGATATAIAGQGVTP
jgi:hypothetical protein